jgi:hypothetical protein
MASTAGLAAASSIGACEGFHRGVAKFHREWREGRWAWQHCQGLTYSEPIFRS